MSRTAVTVVIVTWNGLDLTRRCLRSLQSQQTTDLDVELVVVDNASTDGTPEALAELADVRLIRLPVNRGFAGGVNAAIRATRGSVVVLLNNDAVAEPDLLQNLVAPFRSQADARLGATTGRVLLSGHFRRSTAGESPDVIGHDGTGWVRDEQGSVLVNSTGNEVTASGNGRDRGWLTPADAPDAPAEVFGFNGGCAALSRTALEDVGLLEESFFMYYEDTELSWRLCRRGWSVQHVPTAVAVHDHAASSGTTSDFFLDHNERNRVLVALIHAPALVVVRAVARTLARCALGPDRRRRTRALLAVLRRVPWALRRRAAVDRRAVTPRAHVAALLVPDTSRAR